MLSNNWIQGNWVKYNPSDFPSRHFSFLYVPVFYFVIAVFFLRIVVKDFAKSMTAEYIFLKLSHDKGTLIMQKFQLTSTQKGTINLEMTISASKK